MAKVDRCPICGVAVKPENLLRHLDSIHPRHPDTPAVKERLSSEPGRVVRERTSRPLRLGRVHIAVIALVVLLGLAAYYVAPYLSKPGAFPCVTGPLVYHWHTQLLIYSGGSGVTIPADIGLSNNCAMPLHTHDATGSIHIETDVNRLYSLGDFFTIWGKPFGSPTEMTVNGNVTNPIASVTLYDQGTIALYYTVFA